LVGLEDKINKSFDRGARSFAIPGRWEMSNVTQILSAIEQGDAKAADELLPLVYEELRRLAAQKMSHEPPGQTLQATALVHEAYIRLVGPEAKNWSSRTHFFAAAAEAMRRILIDNARRKKSLKRGGNFHKIEFEDALMTKNKTLRIDELLSLNEALTKLEGIDKVKADLVKLRFFTGLTIEQAAAFLGISHATAERYWDYTRSWLHLEITQSGKTNKPA
jgi:RNA polymerase sigma factor (TIGR02999 family)